VNALVEIPLDRDRVELIKARFLTLASCMPMEDFLSGWFMGAPAESVLRGNVEDFVAYGFYCSRMQELDPEVGALTLEHRFERRAGGKVPSPSLCPLRGERKGLMGARIC